VGDQVLFSCPGQFAQAEAILTQDPVPMPFRTQIDTHKQINDIISAGVYPPDGATDLSSGFGVQHNLQVDPWVEQEFSFMLNGYAGRFTLHGWTEEVSNQSLDVTISEWHKESWGDYAGVLFYFCYLRGGGG
jgi:hypothetical protein